MRTLLFALIFPFLPAFASGRQTSRSGDLTVYLETDTGIDSIFFSDMAQAREYQFLKFSNPLHVAFTNPINDLYTLDFYTQKGFKRSVFWLRGESIVIKGRVSDKIKIDTVIGSDLYYKSARFREAYAKLLTASADSTTVNSFLLSTLKQNLDNVFSIDVAQNFFYRNISRKHELKKIFPMLANQDTSIRNHPLSPYKKIEKLLTETKIDLTRFKFHTTDDRFEPLLLSPGKKYLIDMWFIGCAPCIEQHKSITENLPLLKASQIEVIGISIDQNHTQWKDFLKAREYGWLNVRETDEWEKKLRADLLIEMYPTYLLIDSEGNILHRANAFTEITNHLKL
jgi:thiol-disulfide isomerase/thioredoxin